MKLTHSSVRILGNRKLYEAIALVFLLPFLLYQKAFADGSDVCKGSFHCLLVHSEADAPNKQARLVFRRYSHGDRLSLTATLLSVTAPLYCSGRPEPGGDRKGNSRLGTYVKGLALISEQLSCTSLDTPVNFRDANQQPELLKFHPPFIFSSQARRIALSYRVAATEVGASLACTAVSACLRCSFAWDRQAPLWQRKRAPQRCGVHAPLRAGTAAWQRAQRRAHHQSAALTPFSLRPQGHAISAAQMRQPQVRS